MLRDGARKAEYVPLVGDGANRWPAVHRRDAARLLCSALEKGKQGAAYHGVAEQGVSMKDILSVISKKLKLPMESKTAEEAGKDIGMLAHMVTLDSPCSSDKTQRDLGWKPVEIGLLEDLSANYF